MLVGSTSLSFIFLLSSQTDCYSVSCMPVSNSCTYGKGLSGSSGGLTGTLLHNSLTSEVFESLQILKAGYKNGVISAGEVQDHLAIDLTMEDD